MFDIILVYGSNWGVPPGHMHMALPSHVRVILIEQPPTQYSFLKSEYTIFHLVQELMSWVIFLHLGTLWH